jgi:predicted Zn-dependent peptidase
MFPTNHRLALFVAGCLLAGWHPRVLGAPHPPAVDIPFDQFTLPNGLRVVVHTDRKAPIVAVNLWYHVGSKNEPRGRSGFAHLFEHLMFESSEHHHGEYFAPFEQIGATEQGGSTDPDLATITLSAIKPRRAARMAALTAAQLHAAARAIRPEALTWVIVGDLAKIEAPLRALGLGELKVVDPDGRVVR